MAAAPTSSDLASDPATSRAPRLNASAARAKTHILIVGAGVAGLVAAASLSRRADVTVLERGPRAGGKISDQRIFDASIDCGPTVLTMKPIFEEAFRQAGGALEEELPLTQLNVLARHFWGPGEKLDLCADKDASIEAVRAFAGASEADAYVAFMADAARTWRTLYGAFIRREEPSFPGLLFRAAPIDLLKLDPYSTYWRALTRRFRDPRLRQLFGRYATYCGSSPFEASSTLKLIAHVEAEGVWAVDGGMKRLARQLEARARKNGAQFRFGCEATAFKDKDGRIGGAVTSDGDAVEADAVIFNGDAAAILGAPSQPPAPSERSQSAITWTFLADAAEADVSAHNVFFSDDYAAEFDDIFEKGRPPASPTTYVFAQDRAVEAPPDRPERFFCLINAPANGDVHDYSQQELAACRTKAFTQMKRAGVALAPRPGEIKQSSPTDYAARFPGTGGALFGPPSHGWRASFRRRGVRTKRPGLYCAGGSVHPGSGLPMAAMSGLMAAEAVTKDFGLT